MIIDAVSDLHGFFPKDLPGGDLLIIGGDLTAMHTEKEFLRFIDWIVKQPYKRKVVIGGNHDPILQENPEFFHENRIDEYIDLDYLCDSGEEMDGFKIWGTPYTPLFYGQNPLASAFGCESECDLEEHFSLIPEDTDILISHGPPHGILDRSSNHHRCGSTALLNRVAEIRPRLHIFGHIHEGYGRVEKEWEGGANTVFYNVSHVNRDYSPINKPVRIVL